MKNSKQFDNREMAETIEIGREILIQSEYHMMAIYMAIYFPYFHIFIFFAGK